MRDAPEHSPIHDDRVARRGPIREQLLRSVYDEYFEFVWRSLGQLGVREPDVTDVAQRVFLTFYLRFPSFDESPRLKGWLFGVCRRHASDYRRSAAFRHEILTDPHRLEREPVGHVEASANELPQRMDAVLEAALEKLPVDQKTVLAMYDLEQIPGQSIAARLGIPAGTVRSRLRLGRHNLRREVLRLMARTPMAPGHRRASEP